MTMKSIQQWLDEYGESHQNRTNKLIHYICVPLIYFTSLGLFFSIPFPTETKTLWANWAMVLSVFMVIYYLFLSRPIALVIAFFTIVSLALISWWHTQMSISVLQMSVGIFVVAWIMQFIGHKIEGKKPSLFKDIQFLAIGPAWIICHFFNKIGLKY